LEKAAATHGPQFFAKERPEVFSSPGEADALACPQYAQRSNRDKFSGPTVGG